MSFMVTKEELKKTLSELCYSAIDMLGSMICLVTCNGGYLDTIVEHCRIS